MNLRELSNTLMAFSGLIMKMQDTIDSVDLNPVLCTAETCVAADARIMLKTGK